MKNDSLNDNWLKILIVVLCIFIISIPTGLIGIEANSTTKEQDYGWYSIRGTRATINVPNDYQSIQQAIDNASSGNTILVDSGIYYENIVINKSISLIGKGIDKTTINGGGKDNVVSISANWVNISGFQITNAGNDSYDAGISMDGFSNCDISNCEITNNTRKGIRMVHSSYNRIANNYIYSNIGIGIQLYYLSTYNIIINNSININGLGIGLHDKLGECRFNTIAYNNISNNFVGINLQTNCPKNQINHNNIFNNLNHGVKVLDSSSPVDAINNWWGNASGPYHHALNPAGSGDNITEFVDFNPWLSIPYGTTVDYIQIRTAPEIAGAIAGSYAMTADETWRLWAGAYNKTVGYMGDFSMTWSVTNDIGEVHPTIGPNTTFYANRPGIGIVNATYDSIVTFTGKINVTHGALHYIEVIPSSWTMYLNESKQFISQGYDKDNNYIDIIPTWETNCNCTITSNGLFLTDVLEIGTWIVYAKQSNISGTALIKIQVNNSADTDLDGILDWWEVDHNLNPFNPSDADFDSDFDSLTNLQEFLNNTNPNLGDTDGDNFGDGFELTFSKTNPTNWDTNGNSVGDGLEFLQSQGYLGWMQSLPNDWIGMTITWDNYTIFIKTSSSVLEGEFEKESNKLKIKVSGQKGTKGETDIDVPKALCQPENISIKFDGNLIKYNLTQNATYYHIHIEYNHSIHELMADFSYSGIEPNGQIDDEPKDEDDFTTYFYIIALIIVIIIIIIILIVVIKTSNNKVSNDIPELPPQKLSTLLEAKRAKGDMTDETYNDIKSKLKKYQER